jgi:pilus assembly protein CpaF
LSATELAQMVHELSDAITGLGPIEPLLRDPAVTEVMVNGAASVFVERDGRIQPAGVAFEDDRDVLHVIDRVVAPLGLRIDETVPWVDARLPDGSRVHAIVPPLAVAGPTLTIRKFSAEPPTIEDLVARDSLPRSWARFLIESVRVRRNLIVSGGAGAGKTTLLGALAGHIDDGERVITIEDAAELRLQRTHVVPLETRPANVEGRGRVSVRDLVRNALRMRPDRIVVGEVRGPEVLDMLQAMNTGHAGSMSTVHANASRDVVARLEAMALTAGEGVAVDAIRRMLGVALDLIVHVTRRDGTRSVAEIAEVTDALEVRPLFKRSSRAACE